MLFAVPSSVAGAGSARRGTSRPPARLSVPRPTMDAVASSMFSLRARATRLTPRLRSVSTAGIRPRRIDLHSIGDIDYHGGFLQPLGGVFQSLADFLDDC